MNKIFIVFLGFLFFAASLYGADGLESLNDAGTTARDTVTGAIRSWNWIIGMIPLLLSAYATWKLKEYLETKDEQAGGQTEPKFSRYLKLIVAFVGMIVIVYILLGLFGAVFAKKTFGEMWENLVVPFWTLILGF